MIRIGIICTLFCLLLTGGQAFGESYPIVDTGQNACFNNTKQTGCPDQGDRFNGQDAQYKGTPARYNDNGDGTISDLVTGLMWVKARGDKVPFNTAMAEAATCRVGGHDDWRAPTIKELYSLIDFNGWVQMKERDSTPFIDTRYFDFKFGDTTQNERIIDCQDWSSTVYKGKTMGGNATAFGVNFADGRIKGYGTSYRQPQDAKFIRYVRGNPLYGQNAFVDTNNGTISDKATGLIWQKEDSGVGLNWEQGLQYCENLSLGGRSDWRLPNVKELQSIVDYSRSPTATNSAAIDPVFSMTAMESYYWSSTTHMDGPKPSHAAYVAFGRAMGYFAPPQSNAAKRFLDVHGAGAQRSDPKAGDPGKYPQGHGPQGDDIRIYNPVRCVAGGGVAYYEPPYSRIPTWKGGKAGQDPNMEHRQQRQPQSGRMGQSGGQMRGPGKQGGMRNGPPQEAFDACDDKSQGDSCSVETSHGTLKGMCRDISEGTACVPENHRGRGGPPRQ